MSDQIDDGCICRKGHKDSIVWMCVKCVEEQISDRNGLASELLEALEEVQWGQNGHCPYCECESDDEIGDTIGHVASCIVGNAIAKAKGGQSS